MNRPDPQISYDQPLQSGSALAEDTLSRQGFAKAAANALRQVSVSSGYVVSIEGAWGSGKTSTLAMIEELLLQTDEFKPPVIVHYNPWLIGERDALLRHFLTRIASAVKLSDYAKDGRKVSTEITAYAKAFDVVKLIPGAEPWASIVKSVFQSVGNASGAIAEYKTPDLEQNKQRVEEALKKFPQPIIVFIDDIDRLFPHEVFEMIRIIKAVGGLSHVGYVLAWDPAYVSGALASLNVPQADTYLDKIVQVRMPLPSLSMSARRILINKALASLDPDALQPRFKNDNSRLSSLYFSGLRELLEQPRDVERVFNTVRLIEPSLRGEIVFADIVGLASLMVKATPLFVLLRKNPNYFVGKLPNDNFMLDKDERLVSLGSDERKAAYQASPSPVPVSQVVHFLFPKVAKEEGAFTLGRVSDVDGHLAHPARLLVALQMSVSSSDVSIESVRRYLHQPDKRVDIAKSLTVDNCLEFLEFLGDVAESFGGKNITDLEELCLSIAGLADKEFFNARQQNREEVFILRPEEAAMRAISFLIKATDYTKNEVIAQKLAESKNALTVAARLVMDSYIYKSDSRDTQLVAPKATQSQVVRSFFQNVLQASTSKDFFHLANPSYILRALARTVPPKNCRKVYRALLAADPTLDDFATYFLQHSFDSTKGQIYSLPDDIEGLTAFCSLDKFKSHAISRLADRKLDYPARAVWRAVAEGKKLYAVDGSNADR